MMNDAFGSSASTQTAWKANCTCGFADEFYASDRSGAELEGKNRHDRMNSDRQLSPACRDGYLVVTSIHKLSCE